MVIVIALSAYSNEEWNTKKSGHSQFSNNPECQYAESESANMPTQKASLNLNPKMEWKKIISTTLEA
jgi:hypothetical protein